MKDVTENVKVSGRKFWLEKVDWWRKILRNNEMAKSKYIINTTIYNPNPSQPVLGWVRVQLKCLHGFGSSKSVAVILFRRNDVHLPSS